MLEGHEDKLRNQKIWDTLYRIQIKLNLKPQMMAELLGLTVRDYYKLKLQCSSIPYSNLKSFLDFFDVSESSFLSPKLDFKELSEKTSCKNQSLPERYLVGASSRVRTVLNLLDFIEKHLGWERRYQVLNHFQVSESCLSNPDYLINLRLSVDIANWIVDKTRANSVLYRVGQNAYECNRQTEVGIDLKNSKNFKELVEKMFQEKMKKYFETNIFWSIESLKDDETKIRGIPNPEAVEKIGYKFVNSKVGYTIREGFFSSMPQYIGLKNSTIERNKCILQGDPYTEFVLKTNSKSYYLV